MKYEAVKHLLLSCILKFNISDFFPERSITFSLGIYIIEAACKYYFPNDD